MKSEIRLETPTFRIKIGTMDKHNLGTLYIETGTYVKALNKEYSVEKLKNDILLQLKELPFVSKEYIYTNDIAEDRISINSSVKFNTELTFKPQNKIGTFKEMSQEIAKAYVSRCNGFESIFKQNGFSCGKTKF